MWAQLIAARLKDDVDDDGVTKLMAGLERTEQPGSGLVRSTAMRDQNDPSRLLVLVVFDSEEAARARESDERRQEVLVDVRELMATMFAGPPEFTDLNVLAEY